ncbi:MAG: carboxypeptidase regulatory-like domain-containing protein [Acidobacteria bacterium]|nr:carboxypeptidase regulatory-like domain-containing protein [Acidobacteriota bacterium]
MRKGNWITRGTIIGFALFAVGCSGQSGSSGPSGKAETTKPAAAGTVETSSGAGGYQVVSVENAGQVTGVIRFGGDPPARKSIEVTKDREVCGKVDHLSEELIVSSDKGLANVVVSLTDIRQGKAMTAKAGGIRLDQKNCVFVPHVLVAPAGQSIDIYNNDGILHNIHTFSEENRPFNKAQPKFLKMINVEFSEPETIRVICDAHGWMSAWIVVADNPYFAVTDENGRFRLGEVPPGTYSLKFWHEKLGEGTGTVTVTAGQESSVEHIFPAG